MWLHNPFNPAGLLCCACPALLWEMLCVSVTKASLSSASRTSFHSAVFLRAIFINTWGCCCTRRGRGSCEVLDTASPGMLPAGVPPTQGGTDPQNWGISSLGTSRQKGCLWEFSLVHEGMSVCARGQREEREARWCGNTGSVQRRKGGNSQW